MAGGCADDDLVRSGVEAAVDEFDVPARHFADQVAAGACAAAILKVVSPSSLCRVMWSRWRIGASQYGSRQVDHGAG